MPNYFSPVDPLSLQAQQRLIEAGAARPEDFVGGRPVPQQQVVPPVGGSTGQADLARALGITVPQLIARQEAKKLELMRKQDALARQLKGYAKGGQVHDYAGANPMEHQFSSNSADYMRNRVDPADLVKGAKQWVPDLLALPGDALDALAYAARKVGKGQSEASVPSLGAGAAIRRWASRAKPNTETGISNPDVPASQEAMRFLNPLMMGNPAKVIKSPLALAALAGLSGDATMAAPLMAGVIKSKGGNWLNNSLVSPERALKRLEQTPSKFALNNWIKGPLTKYMKRDMATEGDPIRALAEQNILHYTPTEYGADPRNYAASWSERPGQAFPAKSNLAKQWDMKADAAIDARSAGEYQKLEAYGPDDAWLAKANPETQVYKMHEPAVAADDLGFEHLTDELMNALGDDLPQHLRVDPKALASGNFSVEAAVRRVHDINKWREAQKIEASQALANNAATHLHKDYGDGFKWVELRAPEGADFSESFPGYADYSDTKALALRDALKYEGDTMGHCVGGYCEDVADGRSKIYSLRDAKGQPHVTVEAVPEDAWNVANRLVISNDDKDAMRELLGGKHYTGVGEGPLLEVLKSMYGEIATPGIRIEQIKGKGNKKPIDDYLPYVQDFVKSGQWSDVGDLQNTGLRHFAEDKNLLGPEVPVIVPKGYHSPEDLRRIFLDSGVPEQNVSGWLRAEGFAKGGLVDINELHGY